MKQKNIEEKKAKRKKEVVYGVFGFAVLQMICAVVFGSLCLIPTMPQVAVLVLLVLAGICLVLIVSALYVMKERFKEIEGGELDAAGQY